MECGSPLPLWKWRSLEQLTLRVIVAVLGSNGRGITSFWIASGEASRKGAGHEVVHSLSNLRACLCLGDVLEPAINVSSQLTAAHRV